jgi:hypothetical protein
MGSPDAFERRRAELELLGGAAGGRVRDADVLASFREAVGPAGLMRGYIEHGHLAVVLGNTLFVHGAVCDRSMGFVPAGSGGRSSGEEAERGPDDDSGPREWAEKLQIWKEEQVAEWIRWEAAPPDPPFIVCGRVGWRVPVCATCFLVWHDNKKGSGRTRHPHFDAGRSWRGGAALMDYAVPGGADGRGVVYGLPDTSTAIGTLD